MSKPNENKERKHFLKEFSSKKQRSISVPSIKSIEEEIDEVIQKKTDRNLNSELASPFSNNNMIESNLLNKEIEVSKKAQLKKGKIKSRPKNNLK